VAVKVGSAVGVGVEVGVVVAVKAEGSPALILLPSDEASTAKDTRLTATTAAPSR
jgi:hypothetical protein